MTHLKPASMLVVILVAGLLPGLAAAGPPPRQATVDPTVWETIEAEGSAEVLVVLREQADLRGAATLPSKEAKGRYVYQALRAAAAASQQGLRAALDRQRATYQSFYLVNAVELQADAAMVRALAARPEVDRIVANPWVALESSEQQAAGSKQAEARVGPMPVDEGVGGAGVEPNLVRVHADDVWALGYTGQGVVVGGQDTGYEWDHPALVNQYRGWDGATADHDYNWHDAIHSGGGTCGANSPEPCDDYGHGTHTMGIVLGDDGLNQVGMAPGAQWIGCRNMDGGVGSPATYIECFEFFLAPYPVGGTPDQGDPALAPDVVNNSWSCPVGEHCDPDTLEAAVDALRQAGIVVVVSGGNEGSTCASMANPPAIYRQSFTVGAFYAGDDEIAGFSNRGPVTYGGETYTKPDIAAPGVTIYSSVPGGRYGWMSGTSMAAPHVTGAVALLLSAAPAYAGDVDAIEQVLTGSAEPITTTQSCGGDSATDVPNNVWGWGILDSLAAVESGILRGTVTDAGTTLPVAGATVTSRQVPGREATTDATGRYSLALPHGTYDVTIRAGFYYTQAITDTTVAAGQITAADFSLEPKPRWYVYFPLAASSALQGTR